MFHFPRALEPCDFVTSEDEMDAVMVPMPFLVGLLIGRRMYFDMDEAEDPTGELMGIVYYSFYPPNSINLWPKTIDDICKSEMESLLQCAKNGAAGSTPNYHRIAEPSSLRRSCIHRRFPVLVV